MVIDPKKILIIDNTSVAGGRAIADWYAVARGLGLTEADYYLLSAPFGTGTGQDWRLSSIICAGSQRPGGIVNEARYTGQTFKTALERLLADAAIEAVLVTPGMPKFDTYNPAINPTQSTVNGEAFITWPLTGQGQPIEARMALALRPTTYVTCGNYLAYQLKTFRNTVDMANQAYNDGNKSGIVPWARDMTMAQVRAIPGAYDPVTRNNYLPAARIGYPGCTLAEVQRFVTDALWAETQDNRAKQHIIGGARYLNNGLPTTQEMAFRFFEQMGCSDLYHFDNATELAEATFYPPTKKLSASAFFGTGLAVSPFAYLVEANQGNTASLFQAGGAVYNNYTAPRGAWGLNWTSFAYNFATMLLTKPGNQAVAAFTSVTEPFSNGLPTLPLLAISLVNGASMLEALFDASGDLINATVWGDPLYRPYKIGRVPLIPHTFNNL